MSTEKPPGEKDGGDASSGKISEQGTSSPPTEEIATPEVTASTAATTTKLANVIAGSLQEPEKQPGDHKPEANEPEPPNPSLTIFRNIDVQKGEMAIQKLPIRPGYRYILGIDDAENVDLYGRYGSSPTQNDYEERATNANTKTRRDPKMDCFSFDATDEGTYHIGIWGNKAAKCDLWIIEIPLEEVPPGFEGAILWPLKKSRSVTDEIYGPFGRPWGNDVDENNPYYHYLKKTALLHGGFDVAAEPGEKIKAGPAEGIEAKVIKNGLLSDPGKEPNWGGYTVVQYTNLATGESICVAYDHITPGSALPEGTILTEETIIGTVFEMNVPGEITHLHLTGAKGTYPACEAKGQKPQKGAISYAQFPGVWFNMSPLTNTGLYR